MIRKPDFKPKGKNTLVSSLRSLIQRMPPKLFWQKKIAPAFWTVASILSLTVNLILIVILILVGRQLFAFKALLQEGLINGLYENFALMDKARIQTTVQVNETIQVVDQIRVAFDLPLQQNTVVTLVEDTPIPGAIVYLNNSAVKTTVILPQGTALNIALDLVVPVDTVVPVALAVPVALDVPVDIPLSQTELHEPFMGLQEVVLPYKEMLSALPDSWTETPLCASAGSWLCGILFGAK